MDGLDVRRLTRIILDFAPQLADVNHNGIVIHNAVMPDGFIELIGGDHPIGMSGFPWLSDGSPFFAPMRRF